MSELLEQIMSELANVKAKILATEAKLVKAEEANDRDFMLAYEQKLVELMREKNRLEEEKSARAPLAGEYSHSIVC